MANKAQVVARFDWCAVKEKCAPGLTWYDLWEWNVWKMKWVRLSNSGNGFGDLGLARQAAKTRSDEIATMLSSNQQLPAAL